jgi:hypothetical protein
MFIGDVAPMNIRDYVCRFHVTDKYDPYIHRLTDEFSNFLLLPILAASSDREPSKYALSTQFLYIQNNSTQFTTIQLKLSYNCLKLLTSHTNEIQITKQN